MSKSKKRGGEKAHRKRIQARNTLIKTKQRKLQEMFQKEMMAQFEKMKEEASKDAENNNLDNDGFVQPTQTV